MKILTVVGARPQFVKAAALSKQIAQTNGIEEILLHTGQHFDTDMSDVFFDELGIPKPRYNLGIGGGSHGAMTGRQLEGIEKVLLEEKPDWVVVYGDTNSTLAGALAAAKLHIPVAHIEAGMRSFDKDAPEEINRILTDQMSSALFVSTDAAKENLKKENIAKHLIHEVGDIMFDAALQFSQVSKKPSWVLGTFLEKPFILATIHRAVNTDKPQNLSEIFLGLQKSENQILLPLHPRTKEKIQAFGLSIPENVIIGPPAGYLEMLWLEQNCRAIVTDSGGVQKEAYFFEKPCITIRDETEWTELVDNGWNVLVGANSEKISDTIKNCRVGTTGLNLYGDGQTSSKIVKKLLNN